MYDDEEITKKDMVWLVVMALFFVVLNVGVHEAGHFMVAQHYGLEPELLILPEIEQNESILNRPLAAVMRNEPGNDFAAQQISFAGLYFEICLALLISIALVVYNMIHGDIKQIMLSMFLLMMVVGWVIYFYPFPPVKNSDIWWILNR